MRGLFGRVSVDSGCGDVGDFGCDGAAWYVRFGASAVVGWLVGDAVW